MFQIVFVRIYADRLSTDVVQALVDLLWDQLSSIMQSLNPSLSANEEEANLMEEKEGQETEASSLSTSQADLTEGGEDSGKEEKEEKDVDPDNKDVTEVFVEKEEERKKTESSELKEDEKNEDEIPRNGNVGSPLESEEKSKEVPSKRHIDKIE